MVPILMLWLILCKAHDRSNSTELISIYISISTVYTHINLCLMSHPHIKNNNTCIAQLLKLMPVYIVSIFGLRVRIWGIKF